MSQQGSNKNALYIAIAGAAVVGGAILYHLLSSKNEEASQQASKVIEDIDALGPPKKDMNGFLSFPYYKEVFTIIQRHAKAKFSKEKSEMLVRRRQLLKDGKTQEYKDLVKEMIQREEATCGDLLQDAMDHIGLNEQEFMQMHSIYMQNPQTQQILMSAQFSPAQQQGPLKLTRQKTKEIFLDSEERKLESMKKMMAEQQQNPMAGQDPMEGMMEMMVEQAKLSDDMYERHGVDEDEFNSAMLHYNLMNDPEVQRKVMENMRKLGFGGMGGMGGPMGGMM
ncbi:hypothetical protein FGO68_gene14440 [Halteria grandinella]|uniref:Uncharacterized protein n=1 Tax=Halteria grandinella TaxID=5974 RepID=A0A8J8NPW9_HALGN|nr:hypothetical protein FGO68_gene14440 [Halteria grandinella]